MNTLIASEELWAWLFQRRDPIGRARLESAAAGNFGHSKAVAGGVFAMKIHIGPRYRIDYAR